jgi:hypothetical protein
MQVRRAIVTRSTRSAYIVRKGDNPQRRVVGPAAGNGDGFRRR